MAELEATFTDDFHFTDRLTRLFLNCPVLPFSSFIQEKKKQPQKSTSAVENAPAPVPTGFLTVRLPKTLRASLEQKMLEEEVSLDELVTYLLMRGLAVK